VWLTSFIGREAETVDVARLVSADRLVTLTGAGGCGKTRLAVRVATEVAATFVGGVWWADLAPLSDDALIVNAVASALAIKAVPGQPLLETLKNYLGDQQALLVLDNCEHVIDASARLVHE
jgi:predicted ATPase